jgi:hypothetical protein
MTTPTPIRTPGAPDAYEPPTATEEIEGAASVAGEAVGGFARAVEIAVLVLIGLLVCPPLLILVVVVGVPLLAMALVLFVLSTPYLIYHHVRAGHEGHAALFGHRLRHAGRALVDLLPHRVVADARHKVHHSGP